MSNNNLSVFISDKFVQMMAANTKNDSFQKEVITIIIIKRNLCNEGYDEVSPRYKFTEKRQEHEIFSLYFSLKKHQRKLIMIRGK